MEPSRSAPSLLSSLVTSTYNQSVKSALWVTISSVSVSRNNANTLACASLNIRVKISVTRLSSVALSSRASRKYSCKPIKPSLRSAQ